MVLEPMAESTINVKEGIERDKFRTGLRVRLGKRKRDDADEKEAESISRPEDDAAHGGDQAMGDPAAKKKKIHGPKGPNPLSVKRSKKGRGIPEEIEEERPTVTGRNPESSVPDGTGIVEPDTEGAQAPSGRRKRKRKHKPGTVDELRQELAEDEGLSA